MLRPAALATLVALPVACSGDPAPLQPTPFAEVCGVAGPLHLLPLAPDERVWADYGSILALGDRYLFIVGTGEHSVSPIFGPMPEHTRVYSVGPCGEDPIVVAHDVERLRIDPHWPDLALACPLRGDDLVRLDLSGAAEPTVLAAGACHARVTDHGLLRYVDVERTTGVDFYPLLDPAPPRFGAPVQAAAPVPVVNGTQSSIARQSDEILLVEPGGDLVSVALPDLQRTVLQTGVVVFAAADDGRYLLYQLAPSTGDDPNNPIGNIHLLDRNTGVTQPVGAGALTLCFNCFPAPGFAMFDVRETGAPHQRLVTLPDLELVDVPPGLNLIVRLADGRWLSDGGNSDPATTSVVDLASGATQVLSRRYGLRRELTDDHLDLLHLKRSYRPQDPAPLVRYFYDGRDPQTLADEANVDAIVRADGRVLTMRSVDAAWLGELTLVDPATGEATHLDDHVIAMPGLNQWRPHDDPDAIIYAVLDGERTGVWLARPAPIE